MHRPEDPTSADPASAKAREKPRDARRKAALKENMARRKAQAKGRSGVAADPDADADKKKE